MVLRVTRFGESILRQTGQAVAVFDDALKTLAADMIETMYAEEGIGLAAQQVEQALMLCVIDVSALPAEDLDFQLDGLRPPVDLIMPLALVNPVVRTLPGKALWGEEGCLSFPGIRGDVLRDEAVEVSYQDLNGIPHLLLCRDWFARVVQHEVDHLKGQLFIDRMDKRQLRMLDVRLKQLKRDTREARA